MLPTFGCEGGGAGGVAEEDVSSKAANMSSDAGLDELLVTPPPPPPPPAAAPSPVEPTDFWLPVDGSRSRAGCAGDSEGVSCRIIEK